MILRSPGGSSLHNGTLFEKYEASDFQKDSTHFRLKGNEIGGGVKPPNEA